jgi:hypothetical protein
MPLTRGALSQTIGVMNPELCSRPIAKGDAAALIGVLAVLQGHALAGDLDDRIIDGLSERLGLQDHAKLEAALDGLNQRLRLALGEQDDPAKAP